MGISGAAFVDAGSLWGVPSDIEALSDGVNLLVEDDSTVRAAVGLSLLWNSPVGPLRVDYAEAFQKENYDQTQQLRFGASTKF